jgi:hypothetical protein
VDVQTLTEHLIEQGLSEKVLSERQLERAVGGAPARRYGLVNRALKTRELIRIRRGLYILPSRYRSEPPHPFAIAQALEPGSYVSFETALSTHGWIPEAVRVTASVVPGRKSSHLEHPEVGSFEFHPLALHREYFLELIERRQLGSQIALLAHPLRALVDLITFRKLDWQGLAGLTDGMRIDEQSLHKITRRQIQTLGNVYKQKRPSNFLSALARELGLD